MNKSDRVDNIAAAMHAVNEKDMSGIYDDDDAADIDMPSAVWLSAKTGAGTDDLRRRLSLMLRKIRRDGAGG